MLMKKSSFTVFVFSIVFSVASSYAQKTTKESHTLYVKLENSIENLKGLFINTQKSYSVTFEKQALISKTLKGHVYKVTHQLDNAGAIALNDFLKNQKGVVYTSFMSNTPPPPPNDIPPTTTDFIASQTYLDQDPGVNALYGWANGANGTGVTVRDVEYGLDIDHEEFVGRNASIALGMSISSDATFSFTTHGTATAGIVFSDDGGYGTKGIAHNASQFILYPEWQQGQGWDRIQAVTNAVNEAVSGDIIIYEMQINGANGEFVMAEYDQLVWDLTKEATDKGVVVVAAAGNGAGNLDSSAYNSYHARGDSGAIIVGATNNTINHTTESFSTYGARVDVNAWGRNVFTTGYGDIQFANDSHQYYTTSFGGTSSATAIMGGCIALLQSYHLSMLGDFMNHTEMRNLLTTTGIAQSSSSFPVGVFPDIKAAMEEIDRLAVLSVSEEENLALMTFFPNPTQDILNIKQLDTNAKEVILYDALGKKLVTTTIDKTVNPIDISTLSAGIYYIKVSSGKSSTTKRIIKK